MSAWWLLLTVPAFLLGVTIMSAFAACAYEKGYADGHRAGWQDGRGITFVTAPAAIVLDDSLAALAARLNGTT